MNKKLLIVDDEEDIVQMMKKFFEKKGYDVFTAFDGEEAIKLVERSPDLILLDVNMPKMNGLEVCNRIREHVSCPIVFLSARIEEADRIKGLAIGGDDYLIKPFSLLELEARIEAHLRRQNRGQHHSKLKFMDELTIDFTERRVFVKKVNIPLVKKEFSIIELLSTHSGQIFDKEQLYETIWGLEASGDSHVVVEHIRKIRGKIAEQTKINYIETVWGVGYRWIG